MHKKARVGPYIRAALLAASNSVRIATRVEVARKSALPGALRTEGSSLCGPRSARVFSWMKRIMMADCAQRGSF